MVVRLMDMRLLACLMSSSVVQQKTIDVQPERSKTDFCLPKLSNEELCFADLQQKRSSVQPNHSSAELCEAAM